MAATFPHHPEAHPAAVGEVDLPSLINDSRCLYQAVGSEQLVRSACSCKHSAAISNPLLGFAKVISGMSSGFLPAMQAPPGTRSGYPLPPRSALSATGVEAHNMREQDNIKVCCCHFLGLSSVHLSICMKAALCAAVLWYA